jgi:hypothetical protein
MTTVIDEKELRKAWLKRKFGSWEYHEDLLKLHDEYLIALHKHWGRPDIQKQFPDFYSTMKSPVFYNFDDIQKPGEIPKNSWKAGKESGWANVIAYNFNRGLGDIGLPFTEYAGMAQDQVDHLNKLVKLIIHHCTNITYLVETNYVNRKGTDDIILNEDVTGPINWPLNWRDEISHELNGASAPFAVRCEAGHPCPKTGYWWTPAKQNSRAYFQQGEVMPDFPDSSYGATIWQWDVTQ